MQKIIAEKLWELIAPILVSHKKKTGRPQKDNKKAFIGIICVLDNGLKWRWLPAEYGKPSTVHGKYMQWIRHGFINEVFEKARTLYFSTTNAFPNWLAVDTSSCKASLAKDGGKSPVDRSKRGLKKGVISDSKGAPLVVSVHPGNQHDSKTLPGVLKLAEKIKRMPLVVVAADSAYDSEELRFDAAQMGFVLHAATNKRRNPNCPIVKPKGRWVVEAAHSWLNTYRGIRTCFVKLTESFLGFLQLASSGVLLRMSGVFG
jgi:transposase